MPYKTNGYPNGYNPNGYTPTKPTNGYNNKTNSYAIKTNADKNRQRHIMRSVFLKIASEQRIGVTPEELIVYAAKLETVYEAWQ